MIYAQIRNSKVRLIQEADEMPGLPEFGWIDITGVSPLPVVGDTYDGYNFNPPVTKVFLRIQANKSKLANDGVDFITIIITLYDKDRVLIPVNRQGRLILRDDKENIYDLLWFQLVNGTVTFDYSTTGNAAIVHIDSQDNYTEYIGQDVYLISAVIDESDTLQIGRVM